MRKSRILSVALTAAMVASIAAASTISASAAIAVTSDIKNGTVGICGSFDNGGWATDLPMTDDDGDGVYEGTIAIDSVAEDMLIEGTVQFKVRLNGSWDDSWGTYEADYDRTYNSQTNCSVPATAGEPLTVKVTFDTTNADPAALANPDTACDTSDKEADLFWGYLPVAYEVVADAPTTEEPSEDAPTTEEPSEDAPSTEESDSTPVQTGDATSAVALAAVVLASLGTAVVMTKKASAKN